MGVRGGETREFVDDVQTVRSIEECTLLALEVIDGNGKVTPRLAIEMKSNGALFLFPAQIAEAMNVPAGWLAKTVHERLHGPVVSEETVKTVDTVSVTPIRGEK
jgi:hypothetical protein